MEASRCTLAPARPQFMGGCRVMPCVMPCVGEHQGPGLLARAYAHKGPPPTHKYCKQAQDDTFDAGSDGTVLLGKGSSLAPADVAALVPLIKAYIAADTFEGGWTKEEVAEAAARPKGLQSFQRARSLAAGEV